MGIPSVTSFDSATSADSRPASLGGFVDRPRLPVAPNSPFFLVHRTGRGGSWEVATDGLGAPTWLPVLQPYPIRPGAAGVRTVTAGEPRSRMWARPVQLLQEDGAIVLPLDLQVDAENLPNGVPAGAYLRESDCIGGVFYHSAWERPRRGIRGNTVTHDMDRASYNRWRAQLVTSGVIPLPSAEVLAEAQRRASRRVDTAARDATLPQEARQEEISKAKARAQSLATATVPGAAKPRATKAAAP